MSDRKRYREDRVYEERYSERHRHRSRSPRDRYERHRSRSRERRARHSSRERYKHRERDVSRDIVRERESRDRHRESRHSSRERKRSPRSHSRHDAYPKERREERRESHSPRPAPKREDSPQREKVDEPVDMEATARAASKAAQEMAETIRLRRERMEKWRKERKEKEVQEVVGKKWSLDDENEDDENDGFNPQDILNAAQEVEEPVKQVKKPKSILFGKSVKKSGKGIEFSIKTIAKPTVISAPRVILEEVDIVDEPVPAKEITIEPIVEEVQVNDTEMEVEELEEDPLDAFMASVQNQVEQTTKDDELFTLNAEPVNEEEVVKVLNQESEEEEEEVEFVPTYDPEINQEDIMAAAAARVAQKRKELLMVDHSQIEYQPFRKNFYVEPPELAAMTDAQVLQRRRDYDGIKVRGIGCPKPVERWSQLGLPPGIHEIIKKVLKYEAPTPIQAQAVPAIMNGRDIIGIAKTGSGKTIAFLLPMLRHIKAQPPVGPQEGPIALIMTPTRELAMQIHKECRHFLKTLNIRAVSCYGGSPIKENIAEVKRGAEIIICTPGRMIDLLCANSGRVTNLQRVTYLVLDESDRMFDMGFEPQVMKIVDNIRPDRQTVLFSATFPRFMEALARRVLITPLEIIVGGRSTVPKAVNQIVQVHPNEESKFLRLLAILGKAANDDPNGKILIFVDRQEAADSMLDQLYKHGYPALSLHGGKDQADRDSVLQDFKSNIINILVATSVAARGLDVKDLKIVVNYECPNHMEDYVHRCGRTGRAGNKGTAYTFIMPSQAHYAIDLVKALTASKATVPNELRLMANKYLERVRLGGVRLKGSGFGGRGLDRLITDRETTKKIQMKIHGGELNETEDAKKNDVGIDKLGLAVPNSSEGRTIVREDAKEVDQSAEEKVIQAAKDRAARLNNMTPADRARQILLDIAKSRPMQGRVATDAACWAEIEINDYPYKARMKVGSKEQIDRISHISGAAITTRGTYVLPGKQPPPGERKLYLFIEADQQYKIDRAKIEMKELLTEATVDSMEESGSKGRYKVL